LTAFRSIPRDPPMRCTRSGLAYHPPVIVRNE